jgi:hypothetical protein
MRRRANLGSEEALADARGLLRARLFVADGTAARICDTLEGMGLTRDDMFETLSETVFTGDEKSIAMDSKLKSAISREMGKRSEKSVRIRALAGEEDGEEDEDANDPYSDDELDLDIVGF